ncbi:MAG: GGDEF domain-containing protein, partial [Lachnospiraceae bacterium]|nr:GGDEF domain-containing protein [Lachnospiraceae bacterium]
IKMIDTFKGIACVVCLKKSEKDGNEEVTIAAANRNYLASVGKLSEEFVPGRAYTYYITKDTNFEALVKSCVSTHKIEHQYVNAELYNAWLDLYIIPLEGDKEGNGYCLFTYEMTPKSDSEKMSDISAETAFEVLKTCIKFRMNDEFKPTLDSIVKDIRHQCESDGCAIILMNTGKRKIDILSFDSGTEFPPTEGDVFFKPEFYDIVETWQGIMSGSNCIIITNEEELMEIEEKSPAWYKSLVYSGVKSLVLYPLRSRNTLYGYIFATNFNVENTAFIREIMELNSYILSAEVENYRMREQLELLGTTDSLTGVHNRNAMNKKIFEFANGIADVGRGIGVVYVDMNGLKYVNDSMGHSEGDKMIKWIAAKLMAVFDSNDIYRAGGDEFVIISPNITKKEFDSRFKKLKASSAVDGEPSFALGSSYSDSDTNIKKIMKAADAEMYKNKAEFYKVNPKAERRGR